jgi:dethiobiotin synthase
MTNRAVPPLFVAGTDTGVGKTFVSACLMHIADAHYWKPFQTGSDDDTRMVHRLSGCDASRMLRPFVSLAAPLAPLHAAEREGFVFDPADVTPPPHPFLVIEGAGGIMVPLAPQVVTLDLMVRWRVTVLLVARSTLGTINHTLLTLRALKDSGLSCLGVVMVGPPAPHNVNAIEDFGYVPVLATIPFDESGDLRGAVKAAAPSLKPALELWGCPLAGGEDPASL